MANDKKEYSRFVQTGKGINVVKPAKKIQTKTSKGKGKGKK